MKQLTFSAMATARLRANKRQYVSLVLGIFLSIFLVASLVLGVYGVYQAFLQRRYDTVGYLDMVALDRDHLSFSQEQLAESELFDQFGQVYLAGSVTGYNLYLGYYDEVGLELMNLVPLEGRLPEQPGEIAIEKSALNVLDVSWNLGEQVELPITPVDGTEETRNFTIVGFLPERSLNFERYDYSGISQFPAIVTSDREPGFAIGRVAIHHLLGFAPGVSLNDGMQYVEDNNLLLFMYGLTATGEQILIPNQSPDGLDQEMLDLLLVVCVLGGALLLACGVGISGAMEGLLSKRREEIGVLRALGATRRQIRRMFGRENWLLALTVSPLALGASCGCVWLLSLAAPENLVFSFQLWLLMPIGIFAMVVILLSGYLPLVRVSRLMPMSVIRNTAMLRRSKAVTAQKEFSPARLIASRQVRFNPTRQIGAALLVGLMLLCSGLLAGLSGKYWNMTVTRQYAFTIDGDGRTYTQPFSTIYEHPSPSAASIQQIRNLPHVKSLTLRRNMTITMVLPQVPRYVMLEGWWGWGIEFGILDEAGFQEAMALKPEIAPEYEGLYNSVRQEYLDFLEKYQVNGEAYPTELVTMDLDQETIEKLNSRLESGKIDVDAINAGREVIIVAPQIWYQSTGDSSYRLFTSEAEAQAAPEGEPVQLVAWNNVVTAGQTLPLIHLYQTDQNSIYYREDATVTVGAVSAYVDENTNLGPDNYMYLITTEQGLANLGFLPEGLERMEIYLDGDITQEEEAYLEEQLTNITRRNQGYTLRNWVATFRAQEQRNRQALTMIFSLALLFFSVAVGMIVATVTRQINAEGRTIGMLRAVGANQQDILGCYSGTVRASIAGGTLIAMTFVLGFLGIYLYYAAHGVKGGIFTLGELALMSGAILAMGAACWFACRFFLGLRIREIVNKSIIENIREL